MVRIAHQYAPFKNIQKILEEFCESNMFIAELKSHALKHHHWKTLMHQLRVNWNLSDLTLGQVWDIILFKNEAIVRDMILTSPHISIPGSNPGKIASL